ncbi:MAG: KH domain-containing protein [Candidatus Pacebacteria bacterium]|nr:KH domain-containing protein [Candidatus Paceibacterota bacterium]
MTKNPSDQEFLEFLVKSIVENPDKVQVERKVDEMGVLLTLKVAAQDMGLIVGREGSTAKAIRSLLRIVGIRNNARVNLKIEEPEGSTRAPREPRSEAPSDSKF